VAKADRKSRQLRNFKGMANKLLLFAIVYLFFATRSLQAFGQARADSLFGSYSPLDIGMNISIDRLKNSNGDSAWVSNMLYYRNNAGLNDSIKVAVKTRGFYRLNQCYFPPLSIKIAKKEAKGTGFEGNKKMKLVLPCDNQKRSNALVVREYLCYKLCQVITPYAFRTRLVNLDLTEQRGKKTRNFKLKGILVEDVEKLAKRCDAKVEEKTSILPDGLQDTSALRFYLFQLLIANTDWSTSAQHNVKLIHQRGGNYISLPYDFDLSGVVNAPYSFVSLDAGTQLPIDNVTQRLYRGYCRAPGVTEFVRKEMLAKEKELMAVPDLLKGELDDKEIRGIKKYLDEFFDILRNDFLFRTKVLENCRAL
jgi:hypothetical protein